MATHNRRVDAALIIAERGGQPIVISDNAWDMDNGGMCVSANIVISEDAIQEYLYEEASCAAEDRRDAERDERMLHDQD